MQLKTQGIDDALIQPYSGHHSRTSLEIYSRIALDGFVVTNGPSRRRASRSGCGGIHLDGAGAPYGFGYENGCSRELRSGEVTLVPASGGVAPAIPPLARSGDQ